MQLPMHICMRMIEQSIIRTPRVWQYPYNGGEFPATSDWYWVRYSNCESRERICKVYWNNQKQTFSGGVSNQVFSWRKDLSTREISLGTAEWNNECNEMQKGGEG